jgi:hypothetical protein
MAEAADLSGRDLRRALRALPRGRRRALSRAVREGRAVDDPRDAALAVALARRIQASSNLPRWLVHWPRERPHGRRAALWLLYAVWLVASVVLGLTLAAGHFWESGGIVRWIFVGVLAYGVVSVPWVLAFTLRMRWNAPEAERRNRELLAQRLKAPR